MEIHLKVFVLIAMFVILIFLMSWNELLPNHRKTKVRYYQGPAYLVTGTLAEKFMISISFQNATRYPFQKELPSGRTCVYFGNGWLSINNLDPNDILFEFNDNEDQTLAVRLADLNGLIEFTPNIFGTWEK